jgi:2Fe-2S ferredoxin
MSNTNTSDSILKLQVVDSDGVEHDIACKSDTTVMEAACGAGLPMEAVCGGSLACATCHVIVAEECFELVGPPSEDEEDMLDQGFDITRTSRLGCQIKMAPDLNHLRVRLPPRR